MQEMKRWIDYAESLSLLLGQLWWDKKSTYWKTNSLDLGLIFHMQEEKAVYCPSEIY